MNFEEFQNQSRFYVVGALEPGEVEEFERERESSAKKLKTLLHNVMPYMKRSPLACACQKLLPLSKTSLCPWCDSGNTTLGGDPNGFAGTICVELKECFASETWTGHKFPCAH